VSESLNPVWNQTFDFVVEDGLHDMLMLEVYDHDTFSRVSSIEVFISLLDEWLVQLQTFVITTDTKALNMFL
jgi:Ca2+-dependent lipid-binding protein